jgi:hypothetical protein
VSFDLPDFSTAILPPVRSHATLQAGKWLGRDVRGACQ